MSKKTITGGVVLLGVLQIVLIVLKAFCLIDWTWLLVLFPMWIEIAFVALVLVFYLIICIIVAIVSEFRE